MSSARTSSLAVFFLSLVLLATAAAAEEARVVQVPEDLEEAAGLEARTKAQLDSRSSFDAFHAFRFTDRRAASGIDFRHHIVDDVSVRYLPVHYDHGNGVVVADVDGDGHLDVYFVTQMGSNGLWKNLGDGTFRDITAAAGVAMTDRVGVTASFADIDNDGDADLYVTTVRHGNVLFENDGHGRFKDVTHDAGLEYSGHSSGAVFFDYDNDGLLDLFLTNVGVYTIDERGRGGYYRGRQNAFRAFVEPAAAERSILYRNLGDGTFRDVSEKTLLVDRSWSGDAAAADVNGDGFQDLYVLNMHGGDHYWENVQGKFFVDRTAKLFPRTPPGTMGVKFFDWNRDGRLDLYLTDMHADMGEDIGPEREKLKARIPPGVEGLEASILGNAFFEGTEDGFSEISDEIGAENYWPWGLSVGDLNADGWDDAFITSSMNYPFRYGLNSLLLNEHGERFRDAELILGVEPRPTGAVQTWFELDCSDPASAAVSGDLKEGWKAFSKPDELDAKGAAGEEAPAASAEAPPRHPHCQGQGGKVVVKASRGSRSSVIFDLDDDGDLDIVTNEFNAEPQVLVSNLAQVHEVRFVKVELEGTRSNRDGFGARVLVVTTEGPQFAVHDGCSGYLSHSRMPLYFGLGDAEAVERIEVRWPSGVKQTVSSPAINTLVRIVEPAAEGAG